MQHRLKNLNQNLPNLNIIIRKREHTAEVRIMLRKFVRDHKLHGIVELSVTVTVHAGSQSLNLEVELVAVAVFVQLDVRSHRISYLAKCPIYLIQSFIN